MVGQRLAIDMIWSHRRHEFSGRPMKHTPNPNIVPNRNIFHCRKPGGYLFPVSSHSLFLFFIFIYLFIMIIFGIFSSLFKC